MPIDHASLETNLRLAVQLDQALLIEMTDRSSLRRWNQGGVAAITNYGSVNRSGSDTHQLRKVGLGGADHFVELGECDPVAETPVSTSAVTIQVTRAALLRQICDIAILTGYDADLNPDTLAADMMESFEGYFNEKVAALFETLPNNVGDPLQPFTVDTFFDAIYELQKNKCVGPYFMGLSPQQFCEFQESLRAENGVLQFTPASQEMLSIFGPGISGDFMGVSMAQFCDISNIANVCYGAAWSAGALGYKTGELDNRNYLGAGTSVRTQDGMLSVEITRDPKTASVCIVGNAYCGTNVVYDDCVVGMTTLCA